jgi:hypothetical protein
MTREEVYQKELELANNNNLSIKNVKLFRGHDEATGLSCDLYINNKKLAYCFDDARGGEMEISAYTSILRNQLEDLEVKIIAQPSYKIDDFGDTPFRHSLEDVVNALAIKKQEDEKYRKVSKKAIVYKKPDGSTWLVSWKNEALAMLIGKLGNKAKTMIKDKCIFLEQQGYIVLNKDYIIGLGIDM